MVLNFCWSQFFAQEFAQILVNSGNCFHLGPIPFRYISTYTVLYNISSVLQNISFTGTWFLLRVNWIYYFSEKSP